MQTYSIKEAAKLLRCHPETLRQLTKQGKAPGRKVGRCYVYLEQDLLQYARGEYNPATRQALARKDTPCHSTYLKTPATGTLPSPRQAAKELDALLAQKSETRRKNSMIA
ncbi:multidrug DMT transporter permease [Chitinimonas sp. BJB300]|nr:multidrug DMT transporter permease [Chitinimonas sp. BJB300]